MPTLYIVPTPIGNLEDATLRALRVLAEVSLIAAEDTRVTRKLLARYEIDTPMESFHAHSGRARLERLLDRLADEDIALVSDAGTPTISDPGRELAAGAAERGHAVVALPGASALTTALAASGIAAESFVFVGFLPRRRAARRALLADFAADARALAAFESPHRLRAALADMRAALGDRRIAVCRELTKLHEEVFRGSISEAERRFANPRGEFTLVVEGASAADANPSAANALAALASAKAEGASAKDAIAAASRASGLSRRRLYRAWLALGGGGEDA